MHKLPLTKRLILELNSLSNSPFTLKKIQKMWKSLGWSYLPSSGDDISIQISINENFRFLVDPLGNIFTNASFPILYWEKFAPKYYDDAKEYKNQKQQFDFEFERAKQLALKILPQPSINWIDKDKNGHKAVIWEGRHGLLILQQACFDPQFGYEINFWLQNCTLEQFVPTSPLIDWLIQRNYHFHEVNGHSKLRQ